LELALLLESKVIYARLSLDIDVRLVPKSWVWLSTERFV